MAFSLIVTFIVKKRNHFKKFELVVLYELSQKYIYYINTIVMNETKEMIKRNNIEMLLSNQRVEELKIYYIILKISYKIKKLINNYIENELKILKYKYIFEDSLSFQFDENNENLISVNSNFFNEKIKFDKKENMRETNLYNIIYLLKKEKSLFQKIIKSINQINHSKEIPIFMIFKYFLFFDFFEGGKIPKEIGNKLYYFLTNSSVLYNGIIKNSDYSLLIRKYNEKKYKNNSNFFSIYEFKREIRTKYFSEDIALKLGYNQKDIINEKMDALMPKIFFKPHEKSVKQLIIENQIRYSNLKEKYYFNKNNTLLYPAIFESSLIYNISKTLIVIIKSYFIYKSEYIFMLDNNFEILANTKNFEDEYYLNQKLLKTYNIRIMDILKIKPDILYKNFKNEFHKIEYQKFIHQVKPEEYFISQFYETMNQNLHKNSKICIISKISNLTMSEDDLCELNDNISDDERNKFIIKHNIKKLISELFINHREVVLHKSYNKEINKGSFIENIAKELTKIPDNDLMLENDPISNNLIISSKNLIGNLLTKKELTNDYIKVSIKLSFYYDRIFYFITIDDVKKLYSKISKTFHFGNKKHYIKSTSKSNKNLIPYNKNYKKTRNIIYSSKLSNNNSLEKNKIINIKNILNKDNNKYNLETFEKTNNLSKINDIRKKINRDKFIYIIKIILTIIIVFILILYSINIFFQRYIIIVSEQILIGHYYNLYAKDSMLYCHSEFLQVYYDYMGLSHNSLLKEEDYQDILIYLGINLRINFYLFYDCFFNTNMLTGHDFYLMYRKVNISKLKNFFREAISETNFDSELDFLPFSINNIDILNRNSEELIYDLNNFLFFKNNGKKVHTYFIRLLFYFSTNMEFVYKDIFQKFDNWAYESYKTYIYVKLMYYILFEILGAILYIIFCITVYFYLYYSNEIIMKNIIFLLLDFSEKKENNKENNNNIIKLKLLEFKKLIDDFDLLGFEKYSKNMDKLNKSKFIYLKNNTINNSNYNNENNFNSQNKYKIINKIGQANIFSNYINKENLEKKKDMQEPKKNISLNSKEELRNKGINNSSHNYLIESNSQLFKDKLNKKSNNDSNVFFLNNKSNSINNLVNNITKQKKSSLNYNSLNKEEKGKNDNIKEILLNKLKKNIIMMIKIYIYIILIIILALATFSVAKIKYFIQFNNKFNNFFEDFMSITNRYSILYYYFNTIRTLLIFPDGDRKKLLVNIMEEMLINYDQGNEAFSKALTNMNNYKELEYFLNLLMESNNNSKEIIKEDICVDNRKCLQYLNSNLHIFDSGVDMAYKSCINKIFNIFSDYKQLKNKTDINEINLTLINTKDNGFILIGLSLSNMFYYVKEKIYELSYLDILNFIEEYGKNMSLFNIISITCSFFIFLFVIIIVFISIWKFSEPIKESSYRINCSFYYIRRYNLRTNINV